MISNHTIDQMEEWTIEKFEQVKNFDVELPYLGEPEPYPAG